MPFDIGAGAGEDLAMRPAFYWGMIGVAVAIGIGVVVGLQQPPPPEAIESDPLAAFLQQH